MPPTSEGEVDRTVGDPARYSCCEKHTFDRSEGAVAAQTVRVAVRAMPVELV